jgi:hypothetical protein
MRPQGIHGLAALQGLVSGQQVEGNRPLASQSIAELIRRESHGVLRSEIESKDGARP